METLRCPTCLSLVLEAEAKRCRSCGKRLRSNGRAIVLGENSRIAARPVLPIERELQARVVAENAARERKQRTAAKAARHADAPAQAPLFESEPAAAAPAPKPVKGRHRRRSFRGDRRPATVTAPTLFEEAPEAEPVEQIIDLTPAAPLVEPTPEPVAEAIPEPVVDSIAAPVVDPAVAPVVDSAVDPIAETPPPKPRRRRAAGRSARRDDSAPTLFDDDTKDGKAAEVVAEPAVAVAEVAVEPEVVTAAEVVEPVIAPVVESKAKPRRRRRSPSATPRVRAPKPEVVEPEVAVVVEPEVVEPEVAVVVEPEVAVVVEPEVVEPEVAVVVEPEVVEPVVVEPKPKAKPRAKRQRRAAPAKAKAPAPEAPVREVVIPEVIDIESVAQVHEPEPMPNVIDLTTDVAKRSSAPRAERAEVFDDVDDDHVAAVAQQGLFSQSSRAARVKKVRPNGRKGWVVDYVVEDAADDAGT